MYVPGDAVGTGTETLFPLVVETGGCTIVLMEYVKVYGAAPLAPAKVMSGPDAFRHTAVVPEIVAVGNGLTVMVAVLLSLVHGAVPITV